MSEPYYSQRARSVCVSLSAFFIIIILFHSVMNVVTKRLAVMKDFFKIIGLVIG